MFRLLLHERMAHNMEFCEKLQLLRKNKGLTQEDLAKQLYVSRTAISKWESGKGYPSIDSLKALSTYFAVSLDELLSSEETLRAAEQDSQQKTRRVRDLVFGLLDCAMGAFLFLPLFGQNDGCVVHSVPLLALTDAELYIKVPYFILVIGLMVWGILTLALQGCTHARWLRSKCKISVGLGVAVTLLFAITLQPYAAVLAFLFLAIKALMLIKWA